MIGRALQERPQARHGRGRLRLDPRARRPFLLRRPQPRGRADQGRRHHRPRLVQVGADRHLRRAAHVDVDPPRRPRPPHAVRPRRLGAASPTTSANGSKCRSAARRCPSPTNCWSKPSRIDGRHYMVAYSFEGWNAHQSLGMLITKRMENAGLKPLGFVANDYGLAAYGLEPITDPRALFSRRHPGAGIHRLGRAILSAQVARSAKWR